MSFRRLRRRRTVRWAVALVLAASTAFVVAGTVHRGEATQRAWGTSRPVVVAVRDVHAGSMLPAGDVAVREWPVGLVPPSALESPPLGRTLRNEVFAGEPIVTRDVSRLDGVAATIPDGWLALAIPVGDATLALRPGDVVVLLATLDPAAGSSGPPTLTIADGARVLAVDERAITVAVPEPLAAKVAYAAATGAITPALRAGG